EELIVLYHQRWEEERAIDELKTHQQERPVLRSQTPGGAGDRGAAAGALRGAGADGRGGQRAGAGPAAAVVHRDVEDPALPVAGGAQGGAGRGRPAALVGGLGGGGGRGGTAGAAPARQPAGPQTQDEPVAQKTSPASPAPSAHQGLPRSHRH